MDVLNNTQPSVYVVSGQAGGEHTVLRVFSTYEAAVAYKEKNDAEWGPRGWEHFITVLFVEG